MNQQTTQQTSIQITLDLQKTLHHSPVFDSVFQQAVTAAFATLGEPAQRMLFNCLERKFGVPQNGVSTDPAAFAAAIEDILGPAAAQLIETRIIHVLHNQVPSFKYIAAGSELFFLDYVEALKDFL
jgi:hypothetical protein